MVLVDSHYRVGDSNQSERLSLFRPPCGPDLELFRGYTESLRGYAVSPDTQLVAVSGVFGGD